MSYQLKSDSLACHGITSLLQEGRTNSNPTIWGLECKVYSSPDFSVLSERGFLYFGIQKLNNSGWKDKRRTGQEGKSRKVS